MRRALRTKEFITKKKAQITYSAQVLIYLMHFPLSVLTKQPLNNNVHLFIHFTIDFADVKYSCRSDRRIGNDSSAKLINQILNF